MEHSIQLMRRAADNIRILACSAVEKAKSGHPGGAMGGADFINVLYSEFLQYDPTNLAWIGRDRFFLDPGHMAPMLYAQLCLAGMYSLDELAVLRQWGSPTTGHPELDILRGVENTSGPLGQGHVYAVGAAIAAKFLAAHTGHPTFSKETIYTYISDGGVQEEISQGAARIAATLGLDNLVMFYDCNDIQLSTPTREVMTENTAEKYRALGWEVFSVDGHDVEQIRHALSAAKQVVGKPTLIIGKCIMGKGALKGDGTSYEASCKTHGAPLGGDAYINTVKNLGGNPDDAFKIFPDVEEMYASRREELIALAAVRRAEETAWEEAHPDIAAQIKEWFSGAAPQIDWSKCVQKDNDATRNASAACLSLLAEQVPNMICASADLSNSDKTDGFLKRTKALAAGDFSGAFLQAGVSELTMACCCIGISLHGGVVAACGTFFVFSDYMKPAVRMAALMQQPVKFIWTHDAFRVGEDGPTHEPVEQEAQIRLMEKLKNHAGKPSMLVLRPADAFETTACWRLAMENTATPTALILSRQNITTLPAGNDYGLAARGGYVVAGSDSDPDVVLVATGSEVATLVAGAALLRKDAGKRVSVVSVPSEGLFRQQSKEYQERVLPAGVKKFGLTAGLPVNLLALVPAAEGTIWGLESFGFSAPYKVLDEKLGFTAENVYTQVMKLFE